MGIRAIVMSSCALAVMPFESLAADYAAPGPLTFQTYELPDGAGGADSGLLVVPDGAGPYPLVVASHGWSASETNQEGWAEQFASWGYVVVVPTFPNTLAPDTATNAGIIEALVAMYRTPPAGSPAEGKVAPLLFALEGHSAGGLATAVAASQLQPQATILFDPVDKDGAGQAALPALCGPLLEVFANPSSCNDDGGWQAYADASTGPQVFFGVIDSTHCDGENFARAACGPFCGGAADETRQAEYARYATAMLEARLKGDAEAAAILSLEALTANAAISGATVNEADDCAAVEEPADAGPDASADGDADSDGDTDADSDGDAGPDVDSDSDTDTDADSDGDTDAGVDVTGADGAGCGCAAVGGPEPKGLLRAILRIL